MQALQIDHHGPVSALTVRDVPRPACSPHEVLIAIEAAAINLSDVASAEGRFDHARLPRILGHDFAGRVCDGPADLIGQDVWGSGGELGIGRDGTHAEYIAIPRDGVALRPRALSVEEAATVGVPFLAAWAALMHRGGLQEGEWVIIAGAVGAVGSAAVQIAAAHHAKVIALVRNASDDARVDAQKVTAIAHAESHDVAEVVRDFVPVHRDARQVLEEWLKERQDDSPALFITRTGRKLSRREAASIIRRIAAQANAHLPEDEKIDVSPHVLRHTFLQKLAETKGVHYAREASGHQSDRYIWRYVKPDQQTLADAIDELE